MSLHSSIDAEELAACRAALRTGSRSFHAASRVLPARVRLPASALYAFCRAADEEERDFEDIRCSDGLYRVNIYNPVDGVCHYREFEA